MTAHTCETGCDICRHCNVCVLRHQAVADPRGGGNRHPLDGCWSKKSKKPDRSKVCLSVPEWTKTRLFKFLLGRGTPPPHIPSPTAPLAPRSSRLQRSTLAPAAPRPQAPLFAPYLLASSSSIWPRLSSLCVCRAVRHIYQMVSHHRVTMSHDDDDESSTDIDDTCQQLVKVQRL